MKSFLTYIILILMTTQSIVSMANAHQSHQPGNRHLSFEDHHHQSAELSLKNAELKQNELSTKHAEQLSSKWDCHHCCHCHGHFTHMALAAASLPNADFFSKITAEYTKQLVIQTINPLYRPPIFTSIA